MLQRNNEYNFLGSTSCLDIETNLLYRETRIFHSGQDASGAYIASMKKIFDGRRVDDRCHWPCLTIATVCGIHVGFDLERGATGTVMLLPLEFRESGSTLPYNAWPDNYPAANTWIQTCSLICEITIHRDAFSSGVKMMLRISLKFLPFFFV